MLASSVLAVVACNATALMVCTIVLFIIPVLVIKVSYRKMSLGQGLIQRGVVRGIPPPRILTYTCTVDVIYTCRTAVQVFRGFHTTYNMHDLECRGLGICNQWTGLN